MPRLICIQKAVSSHSKSKALQPAWKPPVSEGRGRSMVPIKGGPLGDPCWKIAGFIRFAIWCVKNVGLLDGTDGLLGVAGMICLIVSQWIIPENSLRLATVSHWASPKTTNKEEIVSQWIIPSFPTKNNGFIGPIYLLRSHLAALRRLALVTRIHHRCKGTP